MFVGNIFDSAVAGIDVGDIGHSLRFAASRSCYLSWTPGSSGNRKTTQIAFAIKRGALSEGGVYGAGSSSDETYVYLTSTNTLQIRHVAGGVEQWKLETSKVFRDPTGHELIEIDIDTTQATASNRVKIRDNGVQITSFVTANYPSLNSDTYFNHNVTHYIGKRPSAAAYFDGYLSRFCNRTGAIGTAFGYLNTDINEWVSKTQSEVKAVVDAGGTNSFMLDFDNGSSLTTLGYDKSSKGNNWTLNNFSLTAGVNYDWMLDVPGNSYATLNSIDTLVGAPSSGNLSIATNASLRSITSTQAMNSGKWYWETLYVTPTSNALNVGISGPSFSAAQLAGSLGASSDSWAYAGATGEKYTNTTYSTFGATFTTNDVIGVAYDADAGKVWFSKNGVWPASGDPATGVNPAFSGLPSGCRPAYGNGTSGGGQTFSMMAGQAPLHASATYDSASGGYFRYTPPTGFKALCQSNLPDVPAAYLNPSTQVQVKLDTGANIKSTAEAVFSYFLEIIKDRGNANNWQWIDSVRGTSAVLQSNTTSAETTYSAPSGSSVATVLKVPSTGVSNTAGSITSQVSANQDVGFSIVTYTGTGANATVGHGCKVNGVATAPGLVIVKQRTSGTTENWAVWHSSIANTEYVLLNSTGAKATGATYWNSTSPTSTVFSVGSAADTNESSKDFVAYCFAPGFFKIGSYTGNGNADGPYVHTGHKPRWLMIKRIDSADHWLNYDTARATYNVDNKRLSANQSAAEVDSSGYYIDEDAFGFKLRGTDPALNANGGTYIYISIPDVFAKYSLAR